MAVRVPEGSCLLLPVRWLELHSSCTKLLISYATVAVETKSSESVHFYHLLWREQPITRLENLCIFCGIPRVKEATSRFVHPEKFGLNFSSWSFAIRVNLLHLRSFLIYPSHFGVFLSHQTDILWLYSSWRLFCTSQKMTQNIVT